MPIVYGYGFSQLDALLRIESSVLIGGIISLNPESRADEEEAIMVRAVHFHLKPENGKQGWLQCVDGEAKMIMHVFFAALVLANSKVDSMMMMKDG